MRILLIEDAQRLRETLTRGLKKLGFSVDACGDGNAALDLALVHEFDVVVLDLMIPGCNGMEVLRQMRAGGVQTPVLILTAMTDVEHRVAGLDAGADDYLPKPFAFAELVARLHALLRREYGSTANETVIGNLCMDSKSGRISVAGVEVVLQPREFSLLDYLARRHGEIASRTDILEHVYDHAADLHSNAIDVAVSRLRRALRAAGAAVEITAVPRRGYRLDSAAPHPA
jgi:two-component system OmpR family response regulator